MDEKEIKLQIKNTFDQASSGYDLPEIRFFDISAKHLVDLLRLKGRERILDVCTGTGHVAYHARDKLKNGSITGIDISDRMIMIAENKKAYGNGKIKFICCDFDDFQSKNSFDFVTCGFGIFFFPDMEKALRKMKSLTGRDGKIVLSSFASPFMEPQRSMFLNRLQQYNAQAGQSFWMAINTEEKFRALLESAGFRHIEIRKRDCGYFLKDASQWWNIIINTNMRGNLNSLSGKELLKFKQEHLEEVNNLNQGKGIRLEVPVLYAVAN